MRYVPSIEKVSHFFVGSQLSDGCPLATLKSVFNENEIRIVFVIISDKIAKLFFNYTNCPVTFFIELHDIFFYYDKILI